MAFADADAAVEEREESRKIPPFAYNMLHDLESCYWILLWFFLLHVPLHALADYEPTNQHGVSMDIFPEERVVVPAPRLMAIDNNDFISETMSKIHPSMRPASPGVQKVAQAIIFVLEPFRNSFHVAQSFPFQTSIEQQCSI